MKVWTLLSDVENDGANVEVFASESEALAALEAYLRELRTDVPPDCQAEFQHALNNNQMRLALEIYEQNEPTNSYVLESHDLTLPPAPASQGAAHTPGKWRVWRDQDHAQPQFICGMDGDFIAEVCRENTNAKANALLLAAAPDLLAACEAAQKVFAGWKHDENPHNDLARGQSANYDAACDMYDRMTNAIARAKGAQ